MNEAGERLVLRIRTRRERRDRDEQIISSQGRQRFNLYALEFFLKCPHFFALESRFRIRWQLPVITPRMNEMQISVTKLARLNFFRYYLSKFKTGLRNFACRRKKLSDMIWTLQTKIWTVFSVTTTMSKGVKLYIFYSHHRQQSMWPLSLLLEVILFLLAIHQYTCCLP